MRSALIVGDLQVGVVDNYPFAKAVVPPVTELLPRARAAGALVVFVHFAFRANGADVPGEPFDRFRLPIPSLERPAYLEFALAGDDGEVLSYRLDGEARLGEGYICQYCGKLCEVKEPHTSAHGVAGHLRAGVPAGQDEDEAHGRAPLPPETGPIQRRRASSRGRISASK